MSCVISTCMAWTGVVLATREPMSLSGAPRRAMPPVGSSEVAMASVRVVEGWGLTGWFVEESAGSRCDLAP